MSRHGVEMSFKCTIRIGAQDVPVLLGDISNLASIDSLIGKADVVLSTAGPFARIGTPIVDAAVRMGTHYCDITGMPAD